MSTIRVAIADEQSAATLDTRRARRVARMILSDAKVNRAEISVALVDDRTIRRLNRRYLGHDYATDVLSFLLERAADTLEAQIVASGQTAARVAKRLGWPAGDELLLYVVHGLLHVVGYDDATPAGERAMRLREAEYLARLGVQVPAERPARRKSRASARAARLSARTSQK